MPATSGDPGATGSSTSTAFDSAEACARFLDRKTPGELVEIFSESDPLRLVERCARFVWEEGLFLDVDRVVESAIYHVALRTALRPRDVTLDDWLRKCMSHSVSSLLRKDVELVRQAGDKEIAPWAKAHVFIREAMGFNDFKALRACSSFHSMPRHARRAFFALCMDKRSVEECVEAGFGPPEWLREVTLRGLDRLLGLEAHPALTSCEDEWESEADER